MPIDEPHGTIEARVCGGARGCDADCGAPRARPGNSRTMPKPCPFHGRPAAHLPHVSFTADARLSSANRRLDASPGNDVTVDAAGNLHGLYPGTEGADNRRLLIGSHLDTVPDAGAYDEFSASCWQSLSSNLSRTPAPFRHRVIGFSEKKVSVLEFPS